MNYLITIKTAFVVFPLIAFLITIPFILHNYHKYGSINPLRTLIIYSFILYLITIYFLVILPLPNKNDVVEKEGMIRLIPFGFIIDIIKETSFRITISSTYIKALTEPCFYTVIFNLFMTIPYGMYLRYYFKCNLKKTIKLSFLLSLFFEVTQLTGLYFIYPYAYRVFDVDDLIINTLGGVIGYFLMGFLIRFLPSRDKIDEESIKDSMTVSGLRRLTIFFLDMFIWLVLTLFLDVFMFDNRYTKYITYTIYFIIIPIFWNGKTIGSNFLNVRVFFKNKRVLRIFIRAITEAIFNLVLPILVIYISSLVVVNYGIKTSGKIIIILLVFFVLFIYYLINIIGLLISKKMFYDKLSKVEFISTLKDVN